MSYSQPYTLHTLAPSTDEANLYVLYKTCLRFLGQDMIIWRRSTRYEIKGHHQEKCECRLELGCILGHLGIEGLNYVL